MRSYLPPSKFLRHVLQGKIEVERTPKSHGNLLKLLAKVHDPVSANRDWAAFLIAGLCGDTREIRSALLTAADDTNLDTRDEAIVGLARRDRREAIERLTPLLDESIGVVLLEAAAILGEPGLLRALSAMEAWVGGDMVVRDKLRAAIQASEAGVGLDFALADRPAQHRLSKRGK